MRLSILIEPFAVFLDFVNVRGLGEWDWIIFNFFTVILKREKRLFFWE